MKKFLAFISMMLVAVMCCSFVGCKKSKTLTGFDIELAKEVTAYLNETYDADIKVEFLVIDWDQKENMLTDGTIDLVWNGMTINEERLANMEISVPYLSNRQVIVINKDDVATFNPTTAVMGAEAGSAGEGIINATGSMFDTTKYIPYESQLDATRAVATGDVDGIVIDSVMAGYYTTIGSYKNDIVALNVPLVSEQYGIAAKKGNKSLMSKINEGMIALAGNGKLTEIATEFGLQTELLVNSSTVNPLASATDNSWEAVKSSKKLVIGYTLFAPIAYKK